MKLVYSLVITFFLAVEADVCAQQSDSTHLDCPMVTPPKFTIEGIALQEYVHKQTDEWNEEYKDSVNGKLVLQFTVTSTAEIKNIVTIKKIGSVPEKVEKRAQQLLEKVDVSGPATFQGYPIEIRTVVFFKLQKK